jgi:hypothetical protein
MKDMRRNFQREREFRKEQGAGNTGRQDQISKFSKLPNSKKQKRREMFRPEDGRGPNSERGKFFQITKFKEAEMARNVSHGGRQRTEQRTGKVFPNYQIQKSRNGEKCFARRTAKG